ncbi:XRE family transcriptional regulator [Reichenbachiella sp. MALMAid0571]|uniref:helix-turn-helix domain-containing protein n=1 Tax=Reichenbachiella sp. MALMAid0571 TaxID=3143939 RepID=UPI0032DFCB05
MVKDDILSNIGKKIKEERKNKNLNLQEVASRSNITAGLLSKIENFRAVPSLPVLLNISKALDVNMADLVENVVSNKEVSYLLVKKDEGSIEEREDSEGLTYESLIHQDLSDINFRANIVRVRPDCYREPIATDAMELIYVISGTVTYGFDNEEVVLEEGDTFYFDGSFPHSVKNNDKTQAVLFKVYFFVLGKA